MKTRPRDTILSASRAHDGVSENAAAIPAINPQAIRPSDSGAEVADPAAIAPTALKTSRRGFLMNTMMVSAASLATAAAVAAPSIVSAAPAAILPGLVSERTLAALDRVRTAEKLFDRLWDQCDTAKNAVREKHGDRPCELIAWRNNSHTGGSAIERIRNELLRDGEDASIIEQEFRDAKKRYRAVVKAGKDWDKRAGVDLMSKAVDEARAEMEGARRALGSVELQSVTDASAIVCLIYANIRRYNDGGLDPWEVVALCNAGSFMNRWMRGKTRVAARRGGRRSSVTAI